MTHTDNETHATAKYPPGRYGRRREAQPRRRWPMFAAAAAFGLAGLAIAGQLYVQYGPADYAPQVQRFYNVTDDGVTVEFVVRKDAGERSTCTVRARSASGAEVGLAQVDVPTGAEAHVTYRLTTSDRPVTAEVPKCGPLRSR